MHIKSHFYCLHDHDNGLDNDVLIVDSGDGTTTRTTTTSMPIRITTHTTLININSTTTNDSEQTKPHTESLQSNNGNTFLIHFNSFLIAFLIEFSPK